ncbi:MAG: glycosyltransferase family 39 protein [Methanobacterium sp.]|uniref:glycosyltransferase family 39 protein n=1 Tax=Methanobacterium sp. TaxID=2164 RepID=UPI003D65DEE9|nr:glycosyltransferase family 39 protein [Methanobacterium sp.]
MFNSSKLTIISKYSDHIVLASLILIISIIAYYRVLVQLDIGPFSDSCDFLSNALVFAGQGMGYSDLTRPPFFSFLISIIFMTGYVSTNVIFILDGLLYLFGVIGLYYLLKLRFNELESILGALLYATFPIVLVIMGAGFSDLASVSFTIWTFYFLVLAVKKDSKYFYLVFPVAMLAFLTRYNNALIIFPIFLYILINRAEIKNIKNILTGMLVSLLLIIPVFIFFYQKFSNILYPFTSNFVTTSTPRLTESAAYNPNLFFFIEKFPLFIGFEYFFIILIIGFCFFTYGAFKLLKKSKNKKMLPNEFNVGNMGTKLKLTLFIVLLFVFIFSFDQTAYMFSEILFFILSYLLYNLSKNFNIKNLDMHLLFFAWFMAFFIFHSVFAIKDNRYFVVMAPSVSYFLILGLSELSNILPLKIKKNNLTFPIIAIVLTITIILSTTSFLPSINQANNKTKVLNEEISLASEWFINYDPNYKNKIIYSDLWPTFSWYLQTNVNPMPVFKDNQTYYGGVKEFNITTQDNIQYNKELDNNKADYYFSIRQGLNLTHYYSIKQFGKVIIYRRIA